LVSRRAPFQDNGYARPLVSDLRTARRISMRLWEGELARELQSHAPGTRVSAL